MPVKPLKHFKKIVSLIYITFNFRGLYHGEKVKKVYNLVQKLKYFILLNFMVEGLVNTVTGGQEVVSF